MTDKTQDKLRTTLTRALRKVDTLRKRVASFEAAKTAPIAVVGVGLRLPGGIVDLAGLWRVLEGGVETTARIPRDRWDADAYYDPDMGATGKSYVREGAFIDRVDHFDPSFFSITGPEAASMDPQQRLLLETAWEALENAGIVPRSLIGSNTGVFVGMTTHDYEYLLDPFTTTSSYALLGIQSPFNAGRIAYHLGLRGPTLAVDTACSSSTVALHLACQALRAGQTDLALVGGVQLMLSPNAFTLLSSLRALAPDGRSKTFSAAADGYGRGEGVIVLTCERLADAEANGREILAVIRGTAINHDGASNGLTAPSGPAQEQVIHAALADAALEAHEVDFVECHGTGTKLGDPIEVQALAAVYAAARPSPLLVGGIKPNFGHLESAAGLAGVAKVIAALHYGSIPPTINTSPLNPFIDWKDLNVEVVDAPRAWPELEGRPPRAAVSSFGLTGTNSHVILEAASALAPEAAEVPQAEAPETEVQPTPAPLPAPAKLPIVVSGRSEAALREQGARLRQHLREHPELAPLDLAFSLATTRSHFEHRACVFGSDLGSALDELAARGHASAALSGTHGQETTLAFLFTGQGAQRLNMGRELCEALPAFRVAFDSICAQFEDLPEPLEPPLREVLVAKAGSSAAALLDQTRYTQPALFTLEVALAQLLESWGVRPDAVLGHSIGELAAAHVAGIFSLEDACTLVAARAQLMQALPTGGAMASLQANEDEVRPLLGEGVDIAGLNGPVSTVVSGSEAGVLALIQTFDAKGRKTKKLSVSHAFHSHQMDGMLEAFAKVAASITYHPPRIPVVSNVSGTLVETGELSTADYWVRHVREAVRFVDGIRALEHSGTDIMLELGPHGVLTSMASACLSAETSTSLVATLRKDKPELDTLLAALGALHCHGVAVDWAALYAPYAPRRVALPTYAFQRERYWLETQTPSAGARTGSPAEPDDALWTAIEGGDVDTLASLLDAGSPEERDALARLTPRLSTWHRHQLARTTNASYRYTIRWDSLPDSSPPTPTRCLMFGAANELGPRIERALTDAGFELQWVQLGPFENPNSLRKLVQKALSEGVNGAPAQLVLSLLALDESPLAGHGALPNGLAFNLVLSQLLAEQGPGTRLWMLTQAAVSTHSGDPLAHPLQATTWGMGRTLALEQPDTWGGLIDIPNDASSDLLARLPAAITREDHEDQLALRPAGLSTRRLVRAAALPAKPKPFTARDTVLITGGTGAIGSHVARWLATAGAGELVLTSRRGLDAPGARELQAELEALGPRVSILKCDVGTRDSVASLFEQLHQRPAPLRTIIHAAGVLDDGVASAMNAGRFAKVMIPKVDAALLLHEFSSSLELDHFVLFSSVAATIGHTGQSNYTAANAFLDAFALELARQGRPATSVAWGPWAEAGMATDSVVADHTRRQGMRPLDPAEGIDGLALAMTLGDPSVAIIDLDWVVFGPSYAAARPRPLLAEIFDAGPSSSSDDAQQTLTLLDSLRPLSPDERALVVLDLVLDQTSTSLGLGDASAIDPRTAFSDLGLDSLMAVEFHQALQRVTEQTLPATLVFDYPSPQRVGDMLLERIAELLADDQDDLAGQAGQADQADDASDEQVRAALAQIPLERLRSSGLLGSLLQLSEGEGDAQDPSGDDHGDAQDPSDEDDSLDDLDADDLADAVSFLLEDI